jgi:hypothetical protein
MKKIHIFVIILLLFFITILFYHYFRMHNVESFSLFSSNTKTDSTKTDSTEDKFKYFKILPEYNQFSTETREAIKKILKEKPNSSFTDETIEKEILLYEKYGSEEEAKIFIETGEWPLNSYIKENVEMFFKNNKDIKEENKNEYYKNYIKMLANSPVSAQLFNYPLFSATNNMKQDDLVGQAKFIANSNQKREKDKLYCEYSKNKNNKGYDTTNKTIPLVNSLEIDEANYPSLEKIIDGFKFLQKPCNPCTNRCPFSYEGVLAAPYATYWGVSSQTGKTTPEEIKT